MEAAISFDVYGDFYSRIKPTEGREWEDDWDYSEPLKHLNEMVAEAVKKKQLTFKYGRKLVQPILPIDSSDCGNIFDDDGISYWNDVEIWCNIPVKYEDFDWDKFVVSKCPDGFEPRSIYVRPD